MTDHTDRIALLDLDGTVADYDHGMRTEMRKLQSQNEPDYQHRGPEGEELPYLEARRKLIQRQAGFWRNLQCIQAGFDVVNVLESVGFQIHVLTKGPKSTPNAWSEKVEWCNAYLPGRAVTISGDKSLVYGRVLVDDWPAYFESWLKVRPRGLVICVAQPWNMAYSEGGYEASSNVFRYEGSSSGKRDLLRSRIQAAYDRQPREELP